MLIGELFCHGCWVKTMHETEHDEAADPLTLPIVCMVCGRITGPAMQEFDPTTGVPHRDGAQRVPGVGRGILENARADMRQRWDQNMARDGVPLEVLSNPHRRLT